MWQSCLFTNQGEMSNLNTEPFTDASYNISVNFAKRFQKKRFFRNQPIKNKNCLWWPCLLMDWDKMNNLYRGPFTDASYQVSVNLAIKGFQRRRLKCENLRDDMTDAKWWQKLTLPLARWAKIGSVGIPLNCSTVKLGGVVVVMIIYGSWIYNYLSSQCLSPLTLWVRILLMARCHRYNIDKVSQWLTAGQWFSPVSSNNKTDCWNIVECGVKHHNLNLQVYIYLSVIFCHQFCVWLWSVSCSFGLFY